jgi:hypothetical protein
LHAGAETDTVRRGQGCYGGMAATDIRSERKAERTHWGLPQH